LDSLNLNQMKFRTYKKIRSNCERSRFGLWTISTGCREVSPKAKRRAHAQGVRSRCHLFDAADTYGNGLSEELIAKAFPEQRDENRDRTKVGYDFVHHGEARGRGQRRDPTRFSPEAIERARPRRLKRLKTDHVDLLQLHNIRMEQVYDDALWQTLEKLKSSGKFASTASRSACDRWFTKE